MPFLQSMQCLMRQNICGHVFLKQCCGLNAGHAVVFRANMHVCSIWPFVNSEQKNIYSSHMLQVPPFKKAFTETMPYVDYLFGNETEAEAFAESEGWKTKDPVDIATKVCSCFYFWCSHLLFAQCAVLSKAANVACS